MRQPSMLLAALAAAALSLSHVAQAENNAPNPYTAERGWGQLPEGRSWGSTSAIYPPPEVPSRRRRLPLTTRRKQQ